MRQSPGYVINTDSIATGSAVSYVEEVFTIGFSHGGYANTEIIPVNLTWDQFVQKMSQVKIGEKDGAYLTRCSFQGNKRENARANQIEFIVIDGDKRVDIDLDGVVEEKEGVYPPELISQALAAHDITHIVVPSHSNLTKGDHFFKSRTWIPAKVQDAAELDVCIQWILHLLEKDGLRIVNVKENLSVSQPWYLPRAANQKALDAFRTYHHDGGQPFPFDEAFAWWESNPSRSISVPGDITQSPISERDDGIGKWLAEYNSANHLLDLLQRNGYKYGHQGGMVDGHPSYYLRDPASQSGGYGVRVYYSNKKGCWVAYSHHQNGILADGHSHDLLSLTAILEHSGDQGATMRALGVERRPGSDSDDLSSDWTMQIPDDIGDQPGEPFHEADLLGDGRGKATLINHPLANFIDYELDNIKADTFVLDDLICDAVTLIAGSQGVGKTTQLVPLFTRIAWLCPENDPLRPLLRRRVIYVAEDTRQVVKILSAMRANNCFGGASMSEIKDWFRIVPAKRMRPEAIVSVVDEYRKCAHLNRNDVNGCEYLAMPFVVFDTSNSSFDLDNESDNAEVGKAISLLKSEFDSIPVAIVSHIAKGLKKADLTDFSARGAGAWEGDVNQVAYIVFDDDKDISTKKRWLEVGIPKHRFNTEIQGVLFDAVAHKIEVVDVLGNSKSMTVLYGVPQVVNRDERKQQIAERAETRQAERVDELRGKILDVVEEIWETSPTICNRDAIKSAVNGKREDVANVITTLINEKWLAEVGIPSEVRQHHNQKSVIARLTEPQREIFKRSSVAPISLDEIPKRWLK